MRIIAFVILVLFNQAAHSAESCFPGATISGFKDLARPWPLDAHQERHTQIQKAITKYGRNIQLCQNRFGDLPQSIQFQVSSDGSLSVRESTVTSETEKCIGEILSQINVGEYPCELGVTYKWTGKFPLINNNVMEFAPQN
jgi:hypothetical protein